jgi:hypothetical protein
MKPTVGRIVHYQAFGTPGGEYPSVPRAAVITQALPLPDFDDGRVRLMDGIGASDERNYVIGLCILNPTGMFFNPDVKFDAEGKPGTWRWPPRDGS